MAERDDNWDDPDGALDNRGNPREDSSIGDLRSGFLRLLREVGIYTTSIEPILLAGDLSGSVLYSVGVTWSCRESPEELLYAPVPLANCDVDAGVMIIVVPSQVRPSGMLPKIRWPRIEFLMLRITELGDCGRALLEGAY